MDVLWEDTASKTGWAFPDQGYAEKRPLLCRSVGFVIRKGKTVISLAQSVEEQGKVNDVIAIPLRAVKRVRRLS